MLKRIIQLTRYNRQQQRSTILLLFILIGILILHNLHLFFDQDEAYSYQFAENASITLGDIKLAEQQQVYIPKDEIKEKQKNKSNTKKSKNIPPKQVEIIPFFFDPNTANKEDFINLGLSHKVTSNILKYRRAGGQFYSKEDLKKIYGLSHDKYAQLEPYILIPTVEKPAKIIAPVANKAVEYTKFAKKEYIHIELNTTTAETLQKLPGIGASYSKRIIKFRDVLGGFAHVDQLMEVYGFPDSTFIKIKPYLSADTLVLKKMNVITQSPDELSKHIYVSWKNAKLIKNYVFQHLDIQHVNELYNIKAVDSNTIKKVLPYLEIESRDLTNIQED